MRRNRRKQIPWGRITGALMGVFVTLSCVLQQVDPFVIFQRATVAVIFTGTIVRCATILLQQSKSPRRRQLTSAAATPVPSPPNRAAGLAGERVR